VDNVGKPASAEKEKVDVSMPAAAACRCCIVNSSGLTTLSTAEAGLRQEGWEHDEQHQQALALVWP
jgi:hypothetical protein